MTELERAIQWLEELKEESRTAAKALKNEVSEEIIEDFNQEVDNCRVLLDALRWIPCAERMPTEDDAVQRAIEMLKEHIKMDEDAIRIRKEIGQTNDEIANSTPAKWLQNNRTILTVLRQYQKPTDEAVQMAIEWLETGKYNTVINGRPYSGNQAHTNVTKDVRETSITALRQMGSTEPCVACLDANHRLSMDGGMYCKYCGRPLKG